MENKKVKNARKKTFDGIDFDSNLEVYTYQMLKKHNIKADYEPIKFVLVDKFKYQNESIRQMTYTPDFVGNNFVIECKGHMNDAFPLKWKLFKKHLHDNNILYDLYLPRNKKQIDEVIKKLLDGVQRN